jgi:hypothetical protein
MTKISLTVPEAAEATGLTEKAIREAIRSQRLKAKRQSVNAKGEPCGKLLIPFKALESYVDSLEDA